MNIYEDGPSLIWGVVCVILLISSLVARRMPLNQVAKMALAWVAIFFALFAIFSFRTEFQTIWERVKSDFAGTSNQSVNAQTIEIKRRDDGHYWLQLEVNGKAVPFLIDSGATTTAINENTAIETSIDVDRSGYPVIISTANGRVTAKRGTIQTILIGPHRIEKHPVVVSESFGDTNVLGMNFLDGMKSWKVEGNVMTLQP
ncbi:MAG: TIGR02281 family clan AA aspartic protease [Sphingorhabdus sp.]|uniref:retropepsin-like aspartic protease family protein n=1 Tax=Sphingorhabdus sp. TaxID=1902408 RepID=UPI0038FD35D6